MGKVKYKVWDDVEKKMFCWQDFKHYDFFEWAEQHNRKNGEVTLLQYIGLKDKNGVEVYAGDVLEIEPETKEYPTSVFFVRSFMSLWGYEFTWEHVSGYDCSTHIAEINDQYEQLLNVEVIGNIYENPELLEVA